MALNPNIPLSVKPATFGEDIRQFGREVSKRREREAETKRQAEKDARQKISDDLTIQKKRQEIAEKEQLIDIRGKAIFARDIALPLIEAGDSVGLLQSVEQRIADNTAKGIDSPGLRKMQQIIQTGNLTEVEQVLKQKVLDAQGLKLIPEAQKPQSKIGKIRADERSGLITKETADAAILRETSPSTEKSKNLFAKVDPSKFTPKSLGVFAQTGKHADLITKPKDLIGGLTAGEKAVDKAFSKEYVAWITGGFADVQKNLLQLKSVQKRLSSGEENLTGALIGKVPDSIRTITNPASIEVRDEIEEVVQRNLRLILGAQFTEREGERLIARAYNENLDEAVNAKRVNRLINAIEKAALAKQAAVDYFDKNGTLKGFDGEQFSLDDISRALELEEKGLPSPKTEEEFNALPSGTVYIDPDDGKEYRKP